MSYAAQCLERLGGDTRMANRRTRPLASTFCRAFGVRGTTIRFYPTPAGVECVWEDDEIAREEGRDDRGATVDRRNVSLLTWDEVEALLRKRPAQQ